MQGWRHQARLEEDPDEDAAGDESTREGGATPDVVELPRTLPADPQLSERMIA